MNGEECSVGVSPTHNVGRTDGRRDDRLLIVVAFLPLLCEPVDLTSVSRAEGVLKGEPGPWVASGV